MTRIKVIPEAEATGRLKEIYDELTTKRGLLAEVHKIQSLRPESIVKHMDLYLEIMFTRSELSRAEREMIAVIVSVANGCVYCQQHHGAALNAYWKDEVRLRKLKADFNKAKLNSREIALCNYAQHLTLTPQLHESEDHTQALKQEGLSDEAILDATLVISYFNFVNRMVSGLDVELEDHGGEGFNY